MRNFTHCLSMVTILLFFTSSDLFSQNEKINKKQAIDLVSKNAYLLRLSAKDIENVVVSDAYFDKLANIQLVYLQQTYKGIPVYNSIRSVAFKNEKPVSFTGNFIGKLKSKDNAAEVAPKVMPAVAVLKAAKDVDQPIKQSITAIERFSVSEKVEFGTLGASRENITTRLLWVPSKDGKLTLCWQVFIAPVSSSDYWLINVDAANGSVVSKDNLTSKDRWGKPVDDKQQSNKSTSGQNIFAGARGLASATAVTTSNYRVIPFPSESMNHPGGTPVIVTDPWQNAGVGNLATTLGWHNDGTVSHDSTRGNNVWALEDTAGNNGVPKPGAAAISTTPSPSLTFDFPFDSLASPHSASNQKFAITQLFYANNIMHDISYQYGFDEPAGNFQNSNINRNGSGKDYVIADAQDGSDTNNSNFSTPPDGTRPRMQMYLWSSSPYRTLHVNSPASIAGFKTAIESGFSSRNKLKDVGPVTGDVALFNSADPADSLLACAALAGTPLKGKIALIYRGTCNFTDKVKNAQAAGAIAVIVVNRDSTLLTMSGDDSTIIIPAVLIAKKDGDAIKALVKSEQTVNVTLKSVELDGDLDNGVIAHEYTHGISTRLTGGPSNSSCLTNKEQMGEGWSDYFALMTTTNWATTTVTDGSKSRTIGTYVVGEDPATDRGIRNFPYSTDVNIDPWSYEFMASYTNGETHTIGEIWTTVLWDMTWAIIQTDGINPNIYNANGSGGNSVALKLVTEGMKLQPCLPGFLDGRDAILKADTLLYNGKYSCAIWSAFAGRGMGINAKQGSSDSYTDQVADYTPNVAIVKKSADKVQVSQGEEITYTLKATCNCGPITNYRIVDTLPANVTYVSGGTYNAANRTATFTIPSLTSAQSQNFVLKVQVNNHAFAQPDTLFNETVPGNTIPATMRDTSTGAGKWSVTNARSHSAPYSFKAVDADTVSMQTLTSSASFSIKGLSTLSFWHYYNTEEGYDKGAVEISEDSGATWVDANPYIIKNGYNSLIGYTGRSIDTTKLTETIVNLSSFNNKKIRIRFVFTSDEGVGADGWYIDDIVLKNESGVYNIGRLFTSRNYQVNASDTITMITNTVLPLVWGNFTVEKEKNTAQLKWTTMQEQNTADFVIERSTDGTTYAPIGTVKAAGNSDRELSYDFTDVSPIPGINYYRIRQVDKDGHFTYSETRSLSFDGNKDLITMNPNPAKDKIAITVTGNTKPLQVMLFNSKGQKVGKFTINGEYSQLNLPRYSPGVYYVKIIGENISSTKKLIIE